LSRDEKLDYTRAVKCLAKLPAKTPAGIAAGAKSRYDDLVVTHIQQASMIHGHVSWVQYPTLRHDVNHTKGIFLTWHRYYTWVFEQMLRNECNYKGYQPYHNWSWWAADPKNSPFFDGSKTSLSGDGSYIPGRNYSCFPFENPCLMKLEPGSGGGCVTSGPFKE
jgi:tyrosinase